MANCYWPCNNSNKQMNVNPNAQARTKCVFGVMGGGEYLWDDDGWLEWDIPCLQRVFLYICHKWRERKENKERRLCFFFFWEEKNKNFTKKFLFVSFSKI